MATILDWINKTIPGQGEDVGNWDDALRDIFVDLDMRDDGYLNAMGAPYRAVGNNTTDDTAALQACLSDAQTRGLRMYVPPVVGSAYKISGTLATAQSFVQPQVRMAGPEVCKIRSTASTPIFRFVGGSGRYARGGVFYGNLEGSAATAVELQGVCGVDVVGCKFTTLAGGVQFHNSAASSFTEDCVVRRCNFENTVALPIEYKVTSGTVSFHGSGFDRTAFAQPSGATGPQVKIGAGCRVYNAPWAGRFFALATQPLVLNSSVYSVTCHGTMEFEAADALGGKFVSDSSTALVYHAGDVTALGRGIAMGAKYVPVSRVTANGDGTFSTSLRPHARKTTLASGTTTVFTGGEPGKAQLLSVDISGPNYIYQALVHFTPMPTTTGGGVTALNEFLLFDSGTIGVPTLAVAATSPGSLTVTKAAYSSSFAAIVGVADVGTNFLGQQL